MTAISSLVDSLKRELAVPGTFDDIFPNTGRNDLVGALADAFAEAQLNDFFGTIALERADNGSSTDYEVEPDLSLAGGALVVIFASMRFIRAQIRNLNTSERYKAGPVEFETNKASNVLQAELSYLQKRLDDLIKNAKEGARASAGMANVYDSYLARGGTLFAIGGFHSHELYK